MEEYHFNMVRRLSSVLILLRSITQLYKLVSLLIDSIYSVMQRTFYLYPKPKYEDPHTTSYSEVPEKNVEKSA